jgi:hypothetical protein
MLLCFQIRVNFTLVLCIACYHFEFGIAVESKKEKKFLLVLSINIAKIQTYSHSIFSFFPFP